MSQIKGKTVVITGASSGIGEACALRLGREGAKVMLAARRKDRLETLTEKLRAENIDLRLSDRGRERPRPGGIAGD